jgi:hypothetical protein
MFGLKSEMADIGLEAYFKDASSSGHLDGVALKSVYESLGVKFSRNSEINYLASGAFFVESSDRKHSIARSLVHRDRWTVEEEAGETCFGRILEVFFTDGSNLGMV